MRQNLISHTLKYRKICSPEIDIPATDKGKEWKYAMGDNGIGLDAQYAARTFVIFQRFQSKKEYSGMGIGLTI